MTGLECNGGSIRVCGSNIADSIYLHPGAEPAPAPRDGGEPYVSSAYVPVAEKRRLTQIELDDVSSRWHWPSSHCVSTFAIVEALVDEMRALRAEVDGSALDGETIWDRLCESAALTTAGRPMSLGLSERPSGLQTSTFDGRVNRRLGLHLDSWDRLPLHRRHEARTRLCINLGRRNRSLLFVPYAVAAIVDALEGAGCQVDGSMIGGQFCSRFPDVPVLELVIPPGYAYLAPTDNLVHDGSSDASDGPDLTIAWLGFLGFGAPQG